MEEEQEFLAAVADGIIAVYAVDSAIARAQQATSGATARGQPALLCARSLRRVYSARYGMRLKLSCSRPLPAMSFQAELGRLHAYAPGYLVNSVALGQELAAAVLAQNGYPFSLARA